MEQKLSWFILLLGSYSLQFGKVSQVDRNGRNV